jgi:serpin B
LEFKQLEGQTIDASYAKLLTTLKTADSDVQVAIANSLWVNQNVTLKQQFVNNSQKFYQAEITNLDFANPTAKNVINKWVEQKTVNKIPQIVDSTSPEDALYLINAIYFKGNWTKQFDPNLTTQQPFYLQPNAPKPQAMMNQTGDYRYYANDQFQAIRLPYGKNAELGMYIFLPKETSNLQQFNQQLNIDNWQEWLSQMRSRQGTITLPRFKLEYETQLNDVLMSLGMKKIFTSSQADFSQMTDTSVALDSVKHKTVIEVNEEGTEATGVTSIGIRITSAIPKEPKPFTMNINRPFFFAIRDDVTETILFMGNVVDPQS